ncbi:hypothetical protein SAMN04515679_4539 [Pelosinus fermentans]|jgi:hypothetical protein|nr:hypothetical protein FR7_04367 [Pelosinus fermentans DSM 17108]SDR39136.1 hypothetical protein SAMN04515679_4539 [Pelosinus fermentans]
MTILKKIGAFIIEELARQGEIMQKTGFHE